MSTGSYSKVRLQLRDPKNDFIFNFNFDDKMKIFEQFEFPQKKSALLYSWEDELRKCSFKPVQVARDWAEQFSEKSQLSLKKLNLEAPNLNCTKLFHFIIQVQVFNDVLGVST